MAVEVVWIIGCGVIWLKYKDKYFFSERDDWVGMIAVVRVVVLFLGAAKLVFGLKILRNLGDWNFATSLL